MHRRYAVDRQARKRYGLPPIQFVNRPDAFRVEAPGRPSRDNERRVSTSRQPAKCRQIQVVVMIVADEHGVDAWQVLPGDPRFSPAARTDPGQRTRSFGPNWVREYI